MDTQEVPSEEVAPSPEGKHMVTREEAGVRLACVWVRVSLGGRRAAGAIEYGKVGSALLRAGLCSVGTRLTSMWTPWDSPAHLSGAAA